MGGKEGKGASIYDVRTRGGRGSPKSRKKEQHQLICDSDKEPGEGVQKSEIFRTSYMEAPEEGRKGHFGFFLILSLSFSLFPTNDQSGKECARH